MLTEEELQEEFSFPIDTDFDNNYLGLFPTVNLIYEISEQGLSMHELVTNQSPRQNHRERITL